MSDAAWIATHTGLPSFRLATTAGTVRALSASDGSRSWSILVTGTGADVLLSDPMAQPGVPVTYSWGSSSWVLTRPVASSQWWRAMISRLDGRTVPSLAWEGGSDKRSWSSPVKRFSSGVIRWALDDPAVTGEGELVLLDPSQGDLVWSIVRAHEPLVIMPGAPTESLPVRVLTVDSVSSERISGDGIVRFTVAWTEVPWSAAALRSFSGAPVVTWGEWKSLDGGWESRTYSELCSLVAGMPS